MHFLWPLLLPADSRRIFSKKTSNPKVENKGKNLFHNVLSLFLRNSATLSFMNIFPLHGIGRGIDHHEAKGDLKEDNVQPSPLTCPDRKELEILKDSRSDNWDRTQPIAVIKTIKSVNRTLCSGHAFLSTLTSSLGAKTTHSKTPY